MRNVVIIQARMGSTRLPGKVLKKLIDKTVLAHVVERTEAFQNVQEIIIATTLASHDDLIIEEARRLGVNVYRGSESDVLSRYYETALRARAETVIRITSDCPLIDPETSSLVIKEYLGNSVCDYASNTLDRTFPRGLDTEVMSFASLEVAHREAREPHHREHVTPYIYTNRERFSCRSVINQDGYADYRWTLDTPEDWDLILKIYETLYQSGRIFSWQEAAALMQRNPEWMLINSNIQQK
ncbi:glycosyltransferase family protein [Paenibacillus alginolyticus]|uniref:cytidylyltransferase domain-containing protein n=1 Tax=Paenibacillus alginolyticus TaxID=59839 RepID=UPI000428F5E6|nr:glycosyltransferase family protein [Paenibacillus alginolyticus]MCY9665098.1 glycosyltransferase family protein [Paenibacillus alginolyticus]